MSVGKAAKAAAVVPTIDVAPPPFDTVPPPCDLRDPLYAVDSSLPVTSDRIAFLHKETGALPAVWFRYLGEVDDMGHPVYPKGTAFKPTLDAPAEAPLLLDAGITLVTIARRSGVVMRGSDVGERCGREDAKQLLSVLDRFPLTSKKVFLDVEMAPTLSSFFYKAWAQEISREGLEPCIYLPNEANWRPQWDALQSAIARGAPCFGTWSAGYFFQSMQETDDGTSKFSRREWDPRRAEGHAAAPALAWQYLGNCYGKQFDFSLLNPKIEPWW